jgi:hypothetical protein
MKLLSTFILISTLTLTTSQLSASGEVTSMQSNNTSNLGVSLDAGICDKYLWRGITYNSGLVFQPAIAITYNDFSLSSWSNIGLSKTDTTNYNEIDLTLCYNHSFSTLNIEGTISYYYYLNPVFNPTIEFNAGIYYSINDFSLFTRTSYDLLVCTGAMFIEVGVDYEKALTSKLTLSGTLLTGFGSKTFNEYYLDGEKFPEVSKSAFNLAGINMGFSYTPIHDFYIEANFLLNFNIDKEVIKALGGNNHSNLVELILRKEF